MLIYSVFCDRCKVHIKPPSGPLIYGVAIVGSLHAIDSEADSGVGEVLIGSGKVLHLCISCLHDGLGLNKTTVQSRI